MKFTKEIIELIKNYIISNVIKSPNTITQRTCAHFGITKPTVLKYINKLIEDKILQKNSTSNRYPTYSLVENVHRWTYPNKNLEEDLLWRKDVSPMFEEVDNNIRDICLYGYTEMVNNVIDHSSAENLIVVVSFTYLEITMSIFDDGIGIFRKIKEDLGLEHSKYAILELAKGKFTSDPENHTGEGIFFTSRVFDKFYIQSHKLSYLGMGNEDGTLFEKTNDQPGTAVIMKIAKNSKTQLYDIFNEYSDSDKNPSFHKTRIPVKLMEYEGESLISRSQAKRLINRFDKFLEVILDFDGVTQIGQAFADQIFRVFQNKHPNVHLVVVNANPNVDKMIKRVSSAS